MVQSHMTFGQQLRSMREARNIGVREMTRLTGLALSHYQYLEKDRISPTDETVGKLAKGLGIARRDLLRLKEDLQVETDLTVLLREAGPLSETERARLLEVAEQILEPEAKSGVQSRQRG